LAFSAAVLSKRVWKPRDDALRSEARATVVFADGTDVAVNDFERDLVGINLFECLADASIEPWRVGLDDDFSDLPAWESSVAKQVFQRDLAFDSRLSARPAWARSVA